MRTLSAIALIGIILGLLFGGLPGNEDAPAADRVAAFVVTRGGVETRTVESADAWDVQPDGKLLIRTPPDGSPTEYYATASDVRADARVTFSDAPTPLAQAADAGNGDSVTRYLVKLDTAAP